MFNTPSAVVDPDGGGPAGCLYATAVGVYDHRRGD